VDVVEAYRTLPPSDLRQRATEILSHQPTWMTFTSSSTVENLIAAVGVEAMRGIRVASIGPITTATLRRHGIADIVEASVYTVDGLVDAILTRRI
jgi:uroporphyrinogen-III synthase